MTHSEDNVAFGSQLGLMLVDVFPGVANMFEVRLICGMCVSMKSLKLDLQAFVNLQQSANYPLHCMPLFPSNNDAEWFPAAMAEDILKSRFREGELKVAGHTRLLVT